MTISFSKYLNKEIFNEKEYPIGTTFTKIYNQMSSLVNNCNFELETYKNAEFYYYHYNTLEKMKIKKMLDTLKINPDLFFSSSNNQDIEIEIENVKLKAETFENLAFFILQLDEFVRLASEEQKINTLEYFILFFTTLNNYSIPNYIIDEPELLKKYSNRLKINLKNQKDDYNIDKHYNDILSNDELILKEMKKADNLIYKYDCKDFIEIMLASYSYILKEKLNLKQCKNCKKFFIALNGNQKFCDNIRPKEITEKPEDYQKTKMTCRNFNKKILSYKNTDEVKKAIRVVTLRIQKRIRVGIETEEYLKHWQGKVRTYRQKYTHNGRYILWILNESDENQIRRRSNGNTGTNKK